MSSSCFSKKNKKKQVAARGATQRKGKCHHRLSGGEKRHKPAKKPGATGHETEKPPRGKDRRPKGLPKAPGPPKRVTQRRGAALLTLYSRGTEGGGVYNSSNQGNPIFFRFGEDDTKTKGAVPYFEY